MTNVSKQLSKDIKKIKYVDLWKEWNEKARNKRKK